MMNRDRSLVHSLPPPRDRMQIDHNIIPLLCSRVAISSNRGAFVQSCRGGGGGGGTCIFAIQKSSVSRVLLVLLSFFLPFSSLIVYYPSFPSFHPKRRSHLAQPAQQPPRAPVHSYCFPFCGCCGVEPFFPSVLLSPQCAQAGMLNPGGQNTHGCSANRY